MTTLEILKRGRARIEQGKCDEAFARDAAGNKIDFDDASACSWCARGALGWDQGPTVEFRRARSLLIAAIGIPDSAGELFNWNDTHTQQDVLDAFDRAIALEPEWKPTTVCDLSGTSP
jgi:hypothetical protein